MFSIKLNCPNDKQKSALDNSAKIVTFALSIQKQKVEVDV